VNERQQSGSGNTALNGRNWVLGTRGQGAASAQCQTLKVGPTGSVGDSPRDGLAVTPTQRLLDEPEVKALNHEEKKAGADEPRQHHILLARPGPQVHR
jgi:hypothetical protein